MDLKKYKFTDDHGHPLENCVDYISMQKEIESLRDRVLIEEGLVTIKNGEIDHLQTEIERLRSENKALKFLRDGLRQLGTDAEKDRDEWERRARLMWEWPSIKLGFQIEHPEAAEWFDEDKYDGI